MATRYYLEVRFPGTADWQRNPAPFPSREEAERAGQELVEQNRPDPTLAARVYDILREKDLAPGAPPLHYRIVEE